MSCNNPKILVNNTPILDQGDDLFREIRIRKWECLKYLILPQQDGKYERKFIVEEWAIFRGAAIVIWSNIVLKMSVSIEWSDSEASLSLLGLATSGVSIEIDGVGRALPGCENVKLRVDQTNILLGNNARMRGRPVLEVATDSIEGWHSCRIHRISGDTLFYLQSHGIDAETAEGMLLEAEIHRCTDLLEEKGDDTKKEVLERIAKK